MDFYGVALPWEGTTFDYGAEDFRDQQLGAN